MESDSTRLEVSFGRRPLSADAVDKVASSRLPAQRRVKSHFLCAAPRNSWPAAFVKAAAISDL